MRCGGSAGRRTLGCCCTGLSGEKDGGCPGWFVFDTDWEGCVVDGDPVFAEGALLGADCDPLGVGRGITVMGSDAFTADGTGFAAPFSPSRPFSKSPCPFDICTWNAMTSASKAP